MGTCRRNWTFSAVFFSCSSLGECCETAREEEEGHGLIVAECICFTRAAELMSKALIS